MNKDDMWGKLLAFGAILVAVGMVLLYFVDLATGSSTLGTGTVIDKEYRAAYTSYNTHTDSKGNTRTTSTHHPARYTLVINVDAIGVKSLDVYSWSYYGYSVSERVITHGTIGGISKLYYLRDISKMKSAEQGVN